VTADRGTELDVAIEALGLIALKGEMVTGDACTATAAQWPLSTQGAAIGAWR
jgi:hypothetical protein